MSSESCARIPHVPPIPISSLDAFHACGMRPVGLGPSTKGCTVTVQKANEVWDAVLGDLQLKVTRPSYETWLKDTVGLSYVDDEFVVGAPNTFIAEMLDQRMYSLISESLESAIQKGVELRFQVLQTEPLSRQALDPQEGSRASDPDNEPVSTRSENGRSGNGSPARLMSTKYNFDSFIVGKSNDLAYAAAMAVSERPGVTYNPLFIYAGVGLGKTHLLHAIGHRIQASGLHLIYATTEEFTNEYISAIREGKTEEFRDRYRTADVLLLDDIQFIIGKEQTQEGFFHTFNALHMEARQIVVTSDRPVTDLSLLEDRVRSRLAGGLVVDIQPPDLETRLAILRAKADHTGQRFPEDVLQFLGERLHKNIRELEGNLTRIAAYAELTAAPITMDLVKKALADTLNPSRARRVTDQLVLDAVAAYFSIDKDTLAGRRRDKETALARHVAMYLLREEANLALTAIGRILGGKDHTTVLHGYHRIASQMDADPHLRQDIINIREALATGQ